MTDFKAGQVYTLTPSVAQEKTFFLLLGLGNEGRSMRYLSSKKGRFELGLIPIYFLDSDLSSRVLLELPKKRKPFAKGGLYRLKEELTFPVLTGGVFIAKKIHSFLIITKVTLEEVAFCTSGRKIEHFIDKTTGDFLDLILSKYYEPCNSISKGS